MPLESCMILLDCSEYMRNGDYVPSRLEAQRDAANLLIGAKSQSHPETTIGVAAGTELLLSPTDNVGKMLSAIHGLHIEQCGVIGGYGSENLGTNNSNNNSATAAHIVAAVQVASLALKHRRNKNGVQRIVLFVGTPLYTIEPRALQKAGRQLKKNNVAIDVVALGELDINEDKLRELVDAANGGRSNDGDGTGGERTCHLVTVPAGVLPSDVLATSPVLAGAGAFAASAAAASAGGGFGGDPGSNPFAEFGVDPNMDPELAMALRVSMEEERARQERAAAAAAAASSESKDAEMTDVAAAAAVAAEVGFSEEEALLQQALAMSMNENDPPGTQDDDDGDTKPAASAGVVDQDVAMAEDDDDDTAMQMALQMSMQDDESKPSASVTASQFQDPTFVSELLGSMPGVDPNDPEIQAALRKAAGEQQGKKKDGQGDSEGDKESGKKG